MVAEGKRWTHFRQPDAGGAELQFGGRDDKAFITITTAVRWEMHSFGLTKAAAAELADALLKWSGESLSGLALVTQEEPK